MAYLQAIFDGWKSMLIPALIFNGVVLIPFFIAERRRPIKTPPRLHDYRLNITISISTLALSLPFATAATLLSAQLHPLLPWQSISLSFGVFETIPIVGTALRFLVMLAVWLFVHDLWFYWVHRLEHRIDFLWAFHKLHHSDANMNASTYARDHFLQTAWRAFVPLFTLGLIFDWNFVDAGEITGISTLFLSVWSMFYHSAIRVQLPWLDRVLVTPQVHRLHHSTNPDFYNCNFADALPIFDIVFGTFREPEKDKFEATGVTDFSPTSIFAAQYQPIKNALKNLRRPAEEAKNVI